MDASGPEHEGTLSAAFSLAWELHHAQTRKGVKTPYITHLMSAAALVGEHGGTEAQMAAALLHDAVEDQGGARTLARIRAQFGDVIAGYVAACTDTDEQPKPPWRPRKQRFLEALAKMPGEVKLIVAADKLHNAQSIVADVCETGQGVWGRFTGGREGTVWYYQELVKALGENWENPILERLRGAVSELESCARADAFHERSTS